MLEDNSVLLKKVIGSKQRKNYRCEKSETCQPCRVFDNQAFRKNEKGKKGTGLEVNNVLFCDVLILKK